MFVKAVHSDRNEFSTDMFATEARNLAGLRGVELRAPVAVPELLGTFSDDGWIALAITEVDGHQPAIPWRPAELDLVVDAVQILGECLTPNPLPVPTITESCVDIFAGWRGLAGGSVDTTGVPAWAVANLDRAWPDWNPVGPRPRPATPCCTWTCARTISCWPATGCSWSTGRTRAPARRGWTCW
jgi:hypothetical protein